MLTTTALFAVLVLAWGSPFERPLAAALRLARKLTGVAGTEIASVTKANARSTARRG